MNQQLPDAGLAHDIIVGIHKRAFYGRLGQYGHVPPNEKEAAALVDLGVGLMAAVEDGGIEKAADAGMDYGEGIYAQCLHAFDHLTGGQEASAPGFEGSVKQAQRLSQSTDTPELPDALKEAAWQAAIQLAHDPAVYGAAIVKRAENTQLLFEHAKAAGLIDEYGNPIAA